MKKIIIEFFLCVFSLAFPQKKSKRQLFSFLEKNECLLIGSKCMLEKDECCRDDYLKCVEGINRSGALLDFTLCQTCFNQYCDNDKDCCERSFPCIENKCSFPSRLKCSSDASISSKEKDPNNCYNSLFGCYEGICSPCGGRECKNGNDCCLGKGYFCDKELGICQRKNNCIQEKYSCAANEDCCHPLGCQNSVCTFCSRENGNCESNSECCSGFSCSNKLCQPLKKDKISCKLDQECQSLKCVMGVCGYCSVSLHQCFNDKDCCDDLNCFQKPGSEKRICSKLKI